MVYPNVRYRKDHKATVTILPSHYFAGAAANSGWALSIDAPANGL